MRPRTDFVRMALLNRMAADPSYRPTLHQTIIWAADPADPPTWPLPLDPTTAMTEPPDLASTTLVWGDHESLPVPADMQSTDPTVNRKIEAINEDQNQGGTAGFLGRFVHSDEIFWPETLSLPDGDIAPLATATASSQSIWTHQTADRAIDGVVDGYPGDYTKEWVTSGEGAGAWLKLTWPEAVTVSRIVLHNRLDLDDQITGATLQFSDGSSVDVGTPLPNDGSALTIDFSPRTVTSVKLEITSVSATTTNVGLAEIEVYANGLSSTGFAIEGSPGYTNTTAATLDCGVSDFSPATMRFRNGNDAWSDWEPYAATKSWTLAGGDGLKTVEGQFQDASNDILDVTDTITLDTTAPTTTATPSVTGWTNGPVTVTLAADDGSGSGVAATYWKIDGGATQTYSAGNKPQLTSSAQTLSYWSTDEVGNSETPHTLQAQINTTAPTTTATPSVTGWTNGPVTVTLAADDGSGSGVAATYWKIDGGATQTYSAGNKPQLTSSAQTLSYWSTDEVGNSETPHTLQAQIDTTAPTTTATPSVTGWTNGPVTVTLAADDGSGSGVAATYWKIDGGATQTYSAGNKPQLTSSARTLSYWSTDEVGNSETPHTLQAQIDTTAPTTTATPSVTGWTNGPVTVTLAADDGSGSGVAATYWKIDGGATQTYSPATSRRLHEFGPDAQLLVDRRGRQQRNAAHPAGPDRHHRAHHHGHPQRHGLDQRPRDRDPGRQRQRWLRCREDAVSSPGERHLARRDWQCLHRERQRRLALSVPRSRQRRQLQCYRYLPGPHRHHEAEAQGSLSGEHPDRSVGDGKVQCQRLGQERHYDRDSAVQDGQGQDGQDSPAHSARR